jgi:putative endonuclease
MVMENKNKGLSGENVVACYLEGLGFSIVIRNFRKIFGEVDIIAHKDSLLVFVEVKMRVSDSVDYGELIGYSKRKKIIATAHAFLMENQDLYDDCVCRFDVAFVTFIDANPRISYVKNAFFENE